MGRATGKVTRWEHRIADDWDEVDALGYEGWRLVAVSHEYSEGLIRDRERYSTYYMVRRWVEGREK